MAIIGSSDSGKRALLRCIPLLEVPTEGDIEVAGETVRLRAARHGREPADRHQINRVRAALGFVFQNFYL